MRSPQVKVGGGRSAELYQAHNSVAAGAALADQRKRVVADLGFDKLEVPRRETVRAESAVEKPRPRGFGDLIPDGLRSGSERHRFPWTMDGRALPAQCNDAGGRPLALVRRSPRVTRPDHPHDPHDAAVGPLQLPLLRLTDSSRHESHQRRVEESGRRVDQHSDPEEPDRGDDAIEDEPRSIPHGARVPVQDVILPKARIRSGSPCGPKCRRSWWQRARSARDASAGA